MNRVVVACIAISCLFKLAAMQQDDISKKGMPEYIVGMKIPNETYAAYSFNPVYMPIAYMGKFQEEKYLKIVDALQALNKLRPINVVIKKADWLGAENYQFYGRELSIESKKILKSLLKIYYDYSEYEPGMPEKYVMPPWHILFGNFALHREFLLKENTTIAGGALFIKQVGKKASVFETN